MSDSSGIVSSKPISIVFGVAFVLFAVIHFILMCWKRTWMMFWLIIGCILEITGYFSSTAGNGAQSLQIIIAPIFFAASIYISFGNLIRKLDSENLLPMNPCCQSMLFVIGDIVSFGLQIAGIVLQLIGDNKSLGTALLIVGFVVQLISFSCFLTLVILTHKKLKNRDTSVNVKGIHSWRAYIKVLYLLIALFFIRNLFRLVEYAVGWGGYIFKHAAFVYVFDGLTMSCSVFLLIIIHPGFVYTKIKFHKEQPRHNLQIIQPDDVMSQSKY